MPQHQEVTCPRCQTNFVCKVGSISLCQCSSSNLSLTEAERSFIQRQYNTCLCINCLQSLQKEYKQVG
ncbi:MAG: cysteine-rich CWC family protein [Bacteroidota bacterium]